MDFRYDAAVQLAGAMEENGLRSEQACETAIASLIRSVRQKLNMEVGFVSEFAGGRRVFRYVDHADGVDVLTVNDSDPLSESYCQRVVDGRLPQLIEDARRNNEAKTLEVTEVLPVGSYVSAPVVLSDGTVYGAFCIFSRYEVPGLNHRALTLVRVFADVISSLIEDSRSACHVTRVRTEEIMDLLDRDQLTLHAQPIYNLNSMSVEGYELLTRISSDLELSPADLFIDADRLGLSSVLGLRVVEKAIHALRTLPEQAYVALNVTPAFLNEFDLESWFSDEESRRVVLELTEHDQIDDYIAMKRRLLPLRARGMRLAIDDAGAGYASMRHILQLGPDIIKLDMSLIRDIDTDSDKQALVAALQVFARAQGYRVVAEGVETDSELTYLRTSAICCGQGFLLSRPQALDYFVS